MWWILHCDFVEYIFAILAELPQVQVQVSLQAVADSLPLPRGFSKGRTVVQRQKLNFLIFYLHI